MRNISIAEFRCFITIFLERLSYRKHEATGVASESEINTTIDIMFQLNTQSDASIRQNVLASEMSGRRKHIAHSSP